MPTGLAVAALAHAVIQIETQGHAVSLLEGEVDGGGNTGLDLAAPGGTGVVETAWCAQQREEEQRQKEWLQSHGHLD
jgi:hypothetical protein